MSPPNESDAAVTVNLHMGQTAVTMRQYSLPGNDACALAAVIDQVIAQVMKSWPRIVYRPEIQKLVNAACAAQIEDSGPASHNAGGELRNPNAPALGPARTR